MDYRIDDDAALLRGALLEFLTERMPTPSTEPAPDSQRHAWRELVGSEWLEHFGSATGEGAGPADRVAALHVTEAFGAVPVTGPVDTVAGYLLPLATATGWSAGLDRLRDGSLVTTTVPGIGPAEPGAAPRRRARRLGAEQDSRHVRLTGTLAHVPCAEVADALVVPVELDGQAGLAIVELDAPGVTRGRSSGADLRRSAADVHLDGAMATSVHIHPDLLGHEHRRTLGHSLFLDAEAVGGGEAVLAHTVTYCTDRIQFGRPIGSFQAVRHRIADAMAKIEGARSLAYRAAWDLGSSEAADMDVLASRLWSSAAYLAAGEAAMQCQGGMGFTWEQGVHVFYRAALSGRGGAEVGASRAAIHRHLRELADPVAAAEAVR